MPLEDMSDNDLKCVAKDVANAARKALTTSISFFGYHEIMVKDIENKIPTIVREVINTLTQLESTVIPMDESRNLYNSGKNSVR